LIAKINRQKAAIKRKDHLEVAFRYALITFLPFWRRAFNTLRPFFVLILLRKPCTFLRLLTFGLNVGPIYRTSPWDFETSGRPKTPLSIKSLPPPKVNSPLLENFVRLSPSFSATDPQPGKSSFAVGLSTCA
jgi:hypothetical protein